MSSEAVEKKLKAKKSAPIPVKLRCADCGAEVETTYPGWPIISCDPCSQPDRAVLTLHNWKRVA